ncbi:Hypothetical predicted protein, partial [Pelobates cultripes]
STGPPALRLSKPGPNCRLSTRHHRPQSRTLAGLQPDRPLPPTDRFWCSKQGSYWG